MSNLGQDRVILAMPFTAKDGIAADRFVELVAGANRQVEEVDTAGATAIGVNAFTVKNGEQATVKMIGTARVEASVAIDRGDNVAASANGRAVTAASGNRILGVALDTSDASGDLIQVLLAIPSQDVAS